MNKTKAVSKTDARLFLMENFVAIILLIFIIIMAFQRVLEEFYVWLETVPVASKSDLDKAIRYALNEKPYLTRFLEDGNIPLSNNRAESAIRPFVVGRKNWLFSATPEGAKTSAVLYSVVTTAKSNGLDVEEYLEKIFSSPSGIVIMPW